jgi:hypothetical protein
VPTSPDDLAGLKAERAAADREYNDALTRLDRAIQQLPADFPPLPRRPDDHQVTPLNTLWKIAMPPAEGRWRGRLIAFVRRAVAPLFEQQQAFNSAVVDHINRNHPMASETRASIDGTQTMLRTTVADLIRFQSLLVMFLQQITPYVDTRDRDVAGLLRGLSGAINAVADEMMKRSEGALVRDRRHDARLGEVEARLIELTRLLEKQAATRATEHG